MTEDPKLDAGPRRWDVLTPRAALLGLAIVLGASAYSFRFTSFMHAKEGVLGFSLVLIVFLSVYEGRSLWPGIRAFAPLWLLLIFALAAHAALGLASVPAFTIEAVVRFATVLLLAACAYDILGASEQSRRFVVACIPVSAAVVALLGLLQYAGLAGGLLPVFPDYSQRVYSVFGNQDLFGGYLAIGLPLAIAWYFEAGSRARSLLLCVVILLVAALSISGARSAWLAAIAGTLIVLPYRRITRPATLALCSVVIATAAAMAVIAPEATVQRATASFSSADVGFKARLWFWDATWRMIRDAPVLGVGPGNFQYWSPSYQGEALRTERGREHYYNELHTLHAHSDLLELAAETGLVGLALAGWMLWRLHRGRGAEWGGLAAYLAFGVFNTTLHSAPHMLAALLLASALAEREPPASPEKAVETPERSWFPLWAPAPVAVVLFAITIAAILVPSYRLNAAREAYEANALSSEDFYLRAVRYPWPAYKAAEEWAEVLFEDRRTTEMGEFVELAARGLDTWTAQYLQGALADFNGNPEAALVAYRASIWRWPDFVPSWKAALELTSHSERASLLAEAGLWLPPEQLAQLSGAKER